MIIEKIFSEQDSDEKLYSVLMDEDEVALFSDFQERLYFGGDFVARSLENQGRAGAANLYRLARHVQAQNLARQRKGTNADFLNLKNNAKDLMSHGKFLESFDKLKLSRDLFKLETNKHLLDSLNTRRVIEKGVSDVYDMKPLINKGDSNDPRALRTLPKRIIKNTKTLNPCTNLVDAFEYKENPMMVTLKVPTSANGHKTNNLLVNSGNNNTTVATTGNFPKPYVDSASATINNRGLVGDIVLNSKPNDIDKLPYQIKLGIERGRINK